MGRLGSESVSRRGEEETRTRHKTTETRCVVASVRAQEHGWVMELYNTHSIGQTVLKFENSKNIGLELTSKSNPHVHTHVEGERT